MRCASAGCSISRHWQFLNSPAWVWFIRMKNRDLGDTRSSCALSWSRFIKVVNPCFALYQPSAGIFSLTASCCHHRWPLIGTNRVHVSKLSCNRSSYWLTWWMLAASITPNCWIWMKLIRSPPKMTFVFSLFWRLLSWKGSWKSTAAIISTDKRVAAIWHLKGKVWGNVWWIKKEHICAISG